MDVNKIFDSFEKASEINHLIDEINKRKYKLSSLFEKKCGNCNYWMTNNCKPEKVNGIFRSCNSFACQNFSQENNFGLDTKIKNEIEELKKRLDEVENKKHI